MKLGCWLGLSCTLIFACSSSREPIARGVELDDGVRTSIGQRDETDAGESNRMDATVTSRSSSSDDSASDDAGTEGDSTVDCPYFGLGIRFESGETLVEFQFREGDPEPSPLDISAQAKWTPGLPPDADNQWPQPLPEAEWDRSETPLASCTIVIHNLPTQCYDLTVSSLALSPSPSPRFIYDNLSDPSAGYNSDRRCDYQPGCRYPYDFGFVDGYYIVSESNDTRVVICGMKCDDYTSAGLYFGPKSDVTCNP